MSIDFPEGPEIALPRGDVTEGVVRIGDTVRRPHQDASPLVAEYLAHLESAGFRGAPRYLGRDAQGRDVLTYLDGIVAGDPVDDWARADDVLSSVAQLLRRLHDASAGWQPSTPIEVPEGRPVATFPVGEERLVAHRDVTPQNVVFRDGAAVGLVDFDLTGWTTRSVDLTNTAMHWVPLADPADRAPGYAGIDVGARWRSMLDAYGRDAMTPQLLLEGARLRFEGGFASMKWAAEHYGGGWRRMWDEGVGDVIRRRVAWFEREHDALLAALD
ncbi:MAG TPA: phosphotransferase [Jatrophihabitantaceae bacterium]|nr:phosphotransferase [Jatrophihabitantaceae bacterium]